MIDIHRVLPHVGSVKGGTLLTIKGTGFGPQSSHLSVEVNGLECAIIHHSPNEIQCWTTSPPTHSEVVADMEQQYTDVQQGYQFKGNSYDCYTLLPIMLP